MPTVTVQQLAEGLNRCFETHAVPSGLLAEDVFCDLLPPFWRFQLQGAGALEAQLRATARGTTTARLLRVVPTASGFVMEHEVADGDIDLEVARRLVLCTVEDGRITEVVMYCNGGWDDALRARHAAEAPMLRP